MNIKHTLLSICLLTNVGLSYSNNADKSAQSLEELKEKNKNLLKEIIDIENLIKEKEDLVAFIKRKIEELTETCAKRKKDVINEKVPLLIL